MPKRNPLAKSRSAVRNSNFMSNPPEERDNLCTDQKIIDIMLLTKINSDWILTGSKKE